MRARLLGALTGAALALAACASTPADTGTAPADLARALAGSWDTRVQAAAAGPARVAARFTPVVAPGVAGGGAQALYVEWRAGSAEGAIVRQQVWTLRTDAHGSGARLELRGLNAANAAQGADAAAPIWASLGPADLHPVAPRADGPDCALTVTARGQGMFDAASDPTRCRAVDAAGRGYGVAIRITLMPTGLLYQETGVYDDDTFAFKSPPEAPYDFRRP